MQITFIAPDIECDGCAASIQKALGRQAGITAVTVAVPAKTVTVQYDEAAVSQNTVAALLTDIGFPPQAQL